MQQIIVFLLIVFTSSQGTYLYLDSDGLQGLSQNLIQTLSTKEFDIGLDYKFGFCFGSIRLSDLKIANLSSNPKQISIKLDQNKQAFDINIKLDQLIAYANIHLKLLGVNAIKEYSQIRIKGTKLHMYLTIDENENKALKFQLYKGKIETFKIGKIKILNGAKWYQKLIRQAEGSVINLFLKGLQKTISKKIAQYIDQYGNQLPNSFNLPKPLDSILIQFPLIDKPTIKDNILKIDFACGSYSKTSFQPSTKKFVSFGVSQDCVNDILHQVWKINDLVNISVIAQQLSDIMEIDSKSLSKLFPGFRELQRTQDVNFRITIDNTQQPNIQIHDGILKAYLPISSDIFLVEIQRIRELENGIVEDYEKEILDEGSYYTYLNLTAEVSVNLRKEYKGFIADLLDIDIQKLKYPDESKFDSAEFSYSSKVLLNFGQSYANQVIYKLMINPENYIDGITTQQIFSTFRNEEFDIYIQY